VPLLAPFPGALIGTWLYQFFVGIHVPDEQQQNEGGSSRRKQLPNANGDDEDEDEVNALNSVVP